MEDTNKYPDFKVNGRVFPLWILQNFRKYKLKPIVRDPGVDPCRAKSTDGEVVRELRQYQAFVGAYLDFRSPYRDVLLYHGLGSGKTATAINVYNMLYNYNPNWNVFILIKASLKNQPWLSDLKQWLRNDDNEGRMANIRFVHYDSPRADRDFIEAVKSADAMNKNMYIIDEAHNFIKNVYNNITTRKGKRAFTIYDYIMREKKENDSVRVILISGTPAVNSPFELALMFNLMRPDIFPMNEVAFNELYISDGQSKVLNPDAKNMFQRRIMGLVSYYAGSTRDLFAEKFTHLKRLPMHEYHKTVYEHYEYVEKQVERRRGPGSKGSALYRSYTRQASNFVFPTVNQQINGESRPRPGQFRLSELDAELLMQGRDDKLQAPKTSIQRYLEVIQAYLTELDRYFENMGRREGPTLADDIEAFKTKYKHKFSEFWAKHGQKSALLTAMYTCSCKMTAIMFYMLRSKGPVLVYSNYVKMEGLEIFKVYMKQFGFTDFSVGGGRSFHRYIEYHGSIDQAQRFENLQQFNHPDNLDGSIVRAILVSPAGSEGISLRNVRQVHVMEPYWNEVRISQLVGRAVRQCSHADLPMDERKVDVFRYLAVRGVGKETTDEEIYELAMVKERLIDTFLHTVREVAVDCELFKEHNMLDAKYRCFRFDQSSFFDGFIGPAYKDDAYYDKKLDNGLNNMSSEVRSVQVVEIKAVKEHERGVGEPVLYWYDPASGVVYDHELDFPVGKVKLVDDIPAKVDDATYIIDQQVLVASIDVL